MRYARAVSDPGPLSWELSACVPKDARAELEAIADLEPVLTGLWRAGKEAWPGVEVGATEFVRHLGAKLPAKAHPGDAETFVRHVHAVDLYLACACARGDSTALKVFDRRFLGRIPEVLRKMDPAGGLTEEVTQRVREKLLMAGERGRPRIADYGGRGPLLTWVRAAAVRAATDLKRGERDEVSVDEVEPFARQLHSGDPELEYIKGKHRDDFKVAFNQALETLSTQERNVLRLYLIDGLNIAAIGQLYGTHRSTIARWIVDSREKLLEQTRRLLAQRLKLSSPAELESLMGLVKSQLDLSINSFLVDPGAKGSSGS